MKMIMTYRNRSFLYSLLLLVLVACEPNTPDPSVASGTSTPVQTENHNGANIHAIVSYVGDISELPATAIVYVFARVPGTKMPLAVERFPPSALPMEVAFQQPKDSVETIEIVARLSLSGEVRQQPLDQQIVSVPLVFSATTQALKLDIPAASSAAPILANDDLVYLNVNISLLEALNLPASTPVFIAAREPSGFPVAVRKLLVGDLPTTIRLTDADSMFKSNKLSRHKIVTVAVRASLSGQPTASPGDWEVISQPITIASVKKPIELAIGVQIE